VTRKSPPEENALPTKLTVSREEAANRLETQIQKGYEIMHREFKTQNDLKVGRSDRGNWVKYTEEMLKRTFSTPQYAEEFLYAAPPLGGMVPSRSRSEPSLHQQTQRLAETLDYKIKALASILERLGLIPEPEKVPKLVDETQPSAVSKRKVFVVHGSDEEAKQSVARFLEKLDLEAIILHEQPNQGRTIIEKLEAHDEVGFAVVLFTPDDVGAPKESESNLKSRARQNVVFELGYFIGKMGRSKVCVLHKESVEILSDYQGVLYVPMDKQGAWRLRLVKELKSAGIEIDLNKAP
jgi:predicted nucleotide-binding protein